ncbi:MAG: dockerin type I repeat-containing protein [Ruminococcus sp.]|nr:dockerin type I repeat-containing protein [Ruminococcus sp.]
MLKKTTTAVLTAIATMVSTVSPLATYAETSEHEHVQTIPDRIITQELMPYSNAPAVLDNEMMPASTTATIPERVYTCTTVPGIEVQPTEFPLRRTYDVNVKVVDSKTNEHVDGVKVHFVETQDLQSNVITRDYGTWDTSESESYSIDIVHLFTNLSSTITLTAVLEDMPEGYSYLNGTTIVDDFIIDNAMDWYYANYYGNEHQPHTDLTISLDKEYKGTVQASCLLIDGNTGEYVEGAEVSLSEWDSNGNLGNCVEWVTTGKEDKVDFDFTIPGGSHFSTVQFVVDKLPEKYNKYTYCPFVENYVGANSSNPSFVLYLYEDGYDSFNTPPVMTDTCTHTTPPIITTTTTTNTIIECKACDHCGTLINANAGITTPLGMFLCSNCKSAGVGGTRPPFYTETVTATSASTNYLTTTVSNIGRACDVCHKFINVDDGIYTPIAFVCKECRSHGAGGTIPPYFTTENATTTETTTTTTTTASRECDTCGKYINENEGINTPIAFVCKECRSLGLGGTRPQSPETPTDPNKVTYGDSNSDNNTNVSDAVFIMQCLSNPNEYKMSAEQKDAADVCNRGDGVTAMDALVIQQISIHVYSLSDLPVTL